jgi:hypothetical protein
MGRIEADAAAAWIPKGKSGWEFGTDADPRQKANEDFNSRLTLPAAERRDGKIRNDQGQSRVRSCSP